MLLLLLLPHADFTVQFALHAALGKIAISSSPSPTLSLVSASVEVLAHENFRDPIYVFEDFYLTIAQKPYLLGFRFLRCHIAFT